MRFIEYCMRAKKKMKWIKYESWMFFRYYEFSKWNWINRVYYGKSDDRLKSTNKRKIFNSCIDYIFNFEIENEMFFMELWIRKISKTYETIYMYVCNVYLFEKWD